MHTIPKNVKNCFAVIFSYELSDNLDGYSSMDQDTIDAAKFMDGYLGCLLYTSPSPRDS